MRAISAERVAIVVTGAIAAGKSTLADALGEAFQLPVRSFGALVRGEARQRGIREERQALQDLGAELFAELGPDGLVDLLLARASTSCVIEGARHSSVVDAIRDRFGLTVVLYIDMTDEILERRYIHRAAESDAQARYCAAVNHRIESSTAGIRAKADIVVDGAEATDELSRRIESLLREWIDQ